MTTVEQLGPADRTGIVETLAAAFYDYPVMRFVLADAGPDYDAHLRALVEMFCEKRLLRGSPVLGIRLEEEIAAVALASEPDAGPIPMELDRMKAELARRVGEDAIRQLERYENASNLDAPETPHYYLGMIGVRPEHQGKGLAKLLLDKLARMAERHPAARGVCLNTEVESNVRLYEHLGYETVGERMVGEMRTWCMIRPTE